MASDAQDDIDRLLVESLDEEPQSPAVPFGSCASVQQRALYLLWSLDAELRDALFEVFKGIAGGELGEVSFLAHWGMRFDMVLELEDRAIQTILREVGHEYLAVTLQGASEPIGQAFAQNLSERAWQVIEEDMRFMGPVCLSDVRRARWAILKIALRLRRAGEIDF